MKILAWFWFVSFLVAGGVRPLIWKDTPEPQKTIEIGVNCVLIILSACCVVLCQIRDRMEKPR